jgi:uncharacterized protein
MIDELRSLLACPKCKGPLESRSDAGVLFCPACRLSYPVRGGLPILLVDEAQVDPA